MILDLFPHDKLLHFAAGSLAALVGVGLSVWLGGPPAAGAVIAATLAGCAKEMYDTMTNGETSLADVLWTVAGSVPVALATLA